MFQQQKKSKQSRNDREIEKEKKPKEESSRKRWLERMKSNKRLIRRNEKEPVEIEQKQREIKTRNKIRKKK